MAALVNTLCHVLVVLYSVSYVTARDFPPVSKHKSFYGKHRHDSRLDSKIIPEDAEIDVFLRRHHIQKLYFLLEGGYQPISVTVTPCSSDATLEWKISHTPFQNSLISSYHAGPWSNHVLRPPPTSPSATYVGRERRSYTNPKAPPGIYALEFRTDTEARAQVLVTTRAPGQFPYHPPLPPEPGVRIVKIKRNRVLVSWKASVSGRPVSYCVSSNNRGNYNSLCSAYQDLQDSHRRHHHLPDPHQNHATLTCVGGKTWHLFKGLQRGRTYFFDVFVVDALTNASSAYTGVSAAVRNAGAHPSKVKDDSLATFALDASNGYAVNAKYHSGKADGPILLFIQSCTGPGPVSLTITQNSSPKREVLSTSVMDVQTLEVPRQAATLANASDAYAISVRSSTRHDRKVRLWISEKRNAFPFPVLPSDKSVKVFESLTTCDSVTVGWRASPDERVKYCIYRQAAIDELMQSMLTEPQNFCEPRTERNSVRVTVLCRRYHRFSRRRFSDVIMQRVRGLLPGTTYLFEVQVTKVKGRMLPYEQVWATTRESCHRNKR